MQAVNVARKRVGPVVAGILKLVQPTVELLRDAGLPEACLRVNRDRLCRFPCIDDTHSLSAGARRPRSP
jgi:hypothetical protein